MSTEDSFDANIKLPNRPPAHIRPTHGRDLSIGGLMQSGVRRNNNNNSSNAPSSGSTRSMRSGTIADYDDAYTKETEYLSALSKSQHADTIDQSAIDYDIDSDLSIDVNTIENDSLLHNALTGSVDLRIFSADNDANLAAMESKLLHNLISNADNYAALHTSLIGCDGVLEAMEQMLIGYQTDLSNISNEINNLQNSTKVITQKLNNRRQSQSMLSSLISNIYVTDDLINTILNTELISEYFIAGLRVLSTRIQYFDTNKSLNFSVKLYGEMYAIVNKLKLKAVQRIRQFMLEKISELDNPKINLSAEKSSLLIYNYYIYFVRSHADSAVYNELQQAYVDVLQKLYARKFGYVMNQFKSNIKAQLWKNDYITNDSTIKQDSGSSVFASKQKKTKETLTEQMQFTADHINSLYVNYNETIVVYDSKKQYELHTVYSYLLNLLVESIGSETLFLIHFFNIKHENDTEVELDDVQIRNLNNIFGALYEQFLSYVSDLIERQDYYDTNSILLLIHYVYKANSRINMGNVKLQNFLQKLNAVLWKKLKTLFESQLSALRSYDNPKYNAADNYIVKRFAGLLTGITYVNATLQAEILDHYCVQFAESVFNLLTRVCAAYKQEQKLVFVLYQCSYVLNTMKLQKCDNTVVHNYYNDKYLSYLNQFIEMMLSEYFGAVVSFLNKYEKAIDFSAVDLTEVDDVNSTFTEQYKQNMAKMDKYIHANFAVSTEDNSILSSVLIQLLLYYQRYVDLVGKVQAGNKGRQFNYISPSTLIYEIKKYTK